MTEETAEAIAAKLTKAQRELLFELPIQCVENYRPAQRLIELGCAVRLTEGGRLHSTGLGDAVKQVLRP